jgi:hypothetical protein
MCIQRYRLPDLLGGGHTSCSQYEHSPEICFWVRRGINVDESTRFRKLPKVHVPLIHHCAPINWFALLREPASCHDVTGTVLGVDVDLNTGGGGAALRWLEQKSSLSIGTCNEMRANFVLWPVTSHLTDVLSSNWILRKLFVVAYAKRKNISKVNEFKQTVPHEPLHRLQALLPSVQGNTRKTYYTARIWREYVTQNQKDTATCRKTQE